MNKETAELEAVRRFDSHAAFFRQEHCLEVSPAANPAPTLRCTNFFFFLQDICMYVTGSQLCAIIPPSCGPNLSSHSVVRAFQLSPPMLQNARIQHGTTGNCMDEAEVEIYFGEWVGDYPLPETQHKGSSPLVSTPISLQKGDESNPTLSMP